MLLQAAGEGHTYLPMQELTQRASRLLEVDPEHIEQHYMNLAMDRKIIMRQVEDSTQIYAATYFYMEANTATRLTQLNAVFDVPDIEIEDRIRKIEKKTGMALDEHQVEAVKEAVRNGVLVITGEWEQEKQQRSIQSSKILNYPGKILCWRHRPDGQQSA